MVGMYREPSFTKAKEVGSQAVYPRASKVLRSPPEGKEEASGSPRMSSLPENFSSTWPLLSVSRKLSCFSAVAPVMGWNQWVKWVAPSSRAHCFMASAISPAV